MNAEAHSSRQSDGRAPDVIVIGAGIIGSSIALRLAQAGLRVAVFDRGEPGGEASSAAAGMIAPQGERLEPEAFSDLCWRSHDLYPQFVAEIEELSRIEVGYRRDGSLLVALDEAQARELDEIAGVQAQRGFEVERLTLEAARERVPGLADGVRRALFLPGDHWVDNERLTAAVIEAARRLGVAFHAGTAVTSFAVRNHRVESMAAAGESYSAVEFVLAAGCWSGTLAASAGIELPTAPCRGQMLEFEGGELPMVVRAGHHYAVPRPDHRVLVGTTAEYTGFEKSVTAGGLASVLDGVLRMMPFLGQCRFRRAWAGLRPDTTDHLPILGRPALLDNLTLATGHFRNGILLAPVTARLIADLVLTHAAPPALEPFRAERFAFEARAGRP
jgi:glycine oxidase